MLVFRAHLSPHCSVESRILEYFLHTLRMILPCSCLHGVLRELQAFSEISRYFTLRTRLRRFDRRLDTHTEAFPSILILPQGPRKVQKASKASKDENRPSRKAFGRIDAPFGRMDTDSGEWLIALVECCWIRANGL